MLLDILLRVLGSRQKHGTVVALGCSCAAHWLSMYAFRQVLVDPAGATASGYEVSDHVVVDLRLRAEYWGLMASALEHTHTYSTFHAAVVSPQEAAAVSQNGTPCQGVSFAIPKT